MTTLRAYINEIARRELLEILQNSTERIPSEKQPELKKELQSFSLSTLKQLSSSKEIRDYLRNTLEMSGEPGQARIAYVVDENTILKVARSNNKRNQNEKEVKNSKCLGEKYAVKVLDFNPEFDWILEERVRIILNSNQLNSTLNEITGLRGTKFEFSGRNDVRDFFAEYPKLITKRTDILFYQEKHNFLMTNNPWYAGFIRGLIGCGVESWDFHFQNWGIRPATGELVLLDLGF
jgi:hypothetical protein